MIFFGRKHRDAFRIAFKKIRYFVVIICETQSMSVDDSVCYSRRPYPGASAAIVRYRSIARIMYVSRIGVRIID